MSEYTEMKGVYGLGLLAGIGVLGLWLATLFFVPRVYPAFNQEDGTTQPVAIENPGIFGDMFGGVNALFSGLSAAGVVVALIVQARALKLQAQALTIQVEQIRDQQQEQASLAAVLEETARLQSVQADTLAKLAASIGKKDRRETLQFLIEDREERIQRIKREKPDGWVNNTPRHRQRLRMDAEQTNLERELTEFRRELESTDRQPASDGNSATD